MNPLKAPPSLLHGFGVPVTQRSSATRTVSFGAEADLFKRTPTAKPAAAAASDELLPSAREAALLLSFSTIAENEIKAMGKKPVLWDDDEDLEDFPKLPLFSSSQLTPAVSSYSAKPGLWNVKLGPRFSPMETDSSSDEDDEDSSDSSYIGSCEERAASKYNQKRARTVSIDSPIPESPLTILKPGVLTPLSARGTGLPNLVSPLSTPVLVKAATGGRKNRHMRQSQKAKRERRPSHKAAAAKKASSASYLAHDDDKKRSLKAVSVPKGKTLKTILRKKFSWKNYPEVRWMRMYVCVRARLTPTGLIVTGW